MLFENNVLNRRVPNRTRHVRVQRVGDAVICN